MYHHIEINSEGDLICCIIAVILAIVIGCFLKNNQS